MTMAGLPIRLPSCTQATLQVGQTTMPMSARVVVGRRRVGEAGGGLSGLAKPLAFDGQGPTVWRRAWDSSNNHRSWPVSLTDRWR